MVSFKFNCSKITECQATRTEVMEEQEPHQVDTGYRDFLPSMLVQILSSPRVLQMYVKIWPCACWQRGQAKVLCLSARAGTLKVCLRPS